MTDDERRKRQPLSMTRRYRRGLILTGLLCALAMLAAATVLFQRSYVERVDTYLTQICDGYAAAYKTQPTHDGDTLRALLPDDLTLRVTLIDADGTVLYDSKGLVIVDPDGNTYPTLPNHADRPEFRQAMADGTASITRESATMQTETHYTLPVWLSTFRTAFGIDWGGTMAASTLFTLPVLALFLIVQRRLVAGLSAGAVKG